VLVSEPDIGLFHLPLKLNNVRYYCQELFHHLLRHLFQSTQVISDTHVCEYLGEPILGNLAVKVGVLYIKSTTLIVVSLVKYSSIRVMPYDLVMYGI
jgi:hypothetical protein